MTHTQQIIQDAIKGGWDNDEHWILCNYEGDWERALLDPLFWQAVGKTRRWDGETVDFNRRYTGVNETLVFKWQYKWHTFIDHLAEGDDYETALSKLV